MTINRETRKDKGLLVKGDDATKQKQKKEGNLTFTFTPPFPTDRKGRVPVKIIGVVGPTIITVTHRRRERKRGWVLDSGPVQGRP